jgi:hypothetical protein
MADVNINFSSDDLKKILDDINKAVTKLSKKEIFGKDDVTNAKQMAANTLKAQNALDRAKISAENLKRTQEKRADNLRKEKGIIGSLEVQVRKLTNEWKSATTAAEKLRIKAELDKVKKELAAAKNTTASWAKALGSFQFKFNALGNIASNVLQNITTEMKQAVRESVNLAAGAQGVINAFNKLPESEKLLQDLKVATRGAVSDLELMRAAVQARNFKIPLEQLGTFLQFAGDRALETGEDFGFMVDSIVKGLGRKSVLILDNLGLSVAEINEEVKKTGDFMVGAANVIEREMAKSGAVVDTSATALARMSAKAEDLKIRLGELLLKGLNLVTGGIEKQSDATIKQRSELNLLVNSVLSVNNTEESRLRLIEDLNKQYPTFLKGVDIEKVTNEQLRDALIDVNEEYDKKIKLLIQEELFKRKTSEFTTLLEEELTLIRRLEQARGINNGTIEVEASLAATAIKNQAIIDAQKIPEKLEKNREEQRLLNEEIQDTVALLKEMGGLDTSINTKDFEDVSSILKTLEKESKTINDLEKDIEDWEEALIGTSDAWDKIGESGSEAVDILKGKMEELNETMEDGFEELPATFEEKLQAILGATANVVASINSLFSAQKNEAIRIAEEEAAKKKELAQGNLEANKRIENELAAETLRIRKDFAKKEQRAAVAQALINQALGITEIWKKWSANPAVAGVLTALALTATGIQIAAIKAQKFEKGGWIGGKLHSQGGTSIEAERGEFMVNRKSASKYKDLLEGINENDQLKILSALDKDRGVNTVVKNDPYLKKLYDFMRSQETGYETEGYYVMTKGNTKTMIRKKERRRIYQ